MRDDHGCHVERGCETTFSGAPCIHGEKLLFCMMMDRGYSEELSCEKSYPMMYSFLHLSCFQRS